MKYIIFLILSIAIVTIARNRIRTPIYIYKECRESYGLDKCVPLFRKASQQ